MPFDSTWAPKSLDLSRRPFILTMMWHSGKSSSLAVMPRHLHTCQQKWKWYCPNAPLHKYEIRCYTIIIWSGTWAFFSVSSWQASGVCEVPKIGRFPYVVMLKPGLWLIDMHAKSKHHLALFIDRQFAAPSLQFANWQPHHRVSACFFRIYFWSLLTTGANSFQRNSLQKHIVWKFNLMRRSAVAKRISQMRCSHFVAFECIN